MQLFGSPKHYPLLRYVASRLRKEEPDRRIALISCPPRPNNVHEWFHRRLGLHDRGAVQSAEQGLWSQYLYRRPIGQHAVIILTNAENLFPQNHLTNDFTSYVRRSFVEAEYGNYKYPYMRHLYSWVVGNAEDAVRTSSFKILLGFNRPEYAAEVARWNGGAKFCHIMNDPVLDFKLEKPGVYDFVCEPSSQVQGGVRSVINPV